MTFHYHAVSRGTQYSPNHIGNDALIFQLVKEKLEAKGHTVSVWDEDSFSCKSADSPFIYSMIRGSSSLKILQELEAAGALVINPTQGVLNCYRANLAQLLPAAAIPMPLTLVVDTVNPPEISPFGENPFRLWIKRGDVHAIHREDITLTFSLRELREVIMEYNRRGIQKAVIQKDTEGPVLKFYAVRGSGFFHWYFHEPGTQRKFDVAKLKAIAQQCAEVLNVDIYGGDAVIGQNGEISIIDLNDWPSFAPVREEASVHIAELIEKKSILFATQNLLKTYGEKPILITSKHT